MASKALLIIIMVAAASGPALAMDYMVGDANGWNTSGNYTQWAAGKNFRVGDNLSMFYSIITIFFFRSLLKGMLIK